nr:TetR/AcrR family transcriptional regulator [uncultured Hyphomonas sp.]
MGELPVSKTAAKREARIAEILDCAEKHFSIKGFHGAGISGIAADCGISVGHLYHYFDSKDELIQAVVKLEMRRQDEGIAAFEDLSPENLRIEMAELTNAIFSTDEEPFRTVLNFEILAEAQRNPDVAELLQQQDKQMRLRFVSILRRAGIDDPETRTELIFTIFSGLSARALRHPQQERAALLEVIKDVILKILGDKPVTSSAACA